MLLSNFNLGLSSWWSWFWVCCECSVVLVQVLQHQLDDWMEAHDEEQERKRKAAEADADDGWTVVKRQKVLQLFTMTCGVSALRHTVRLKCRCQLNAAGC